MQDGAEDDRAKIVDAALLVAGGSAAGLLWAIEAGLLALVASAGNYRSDVPPVRGAEPVQ